MPRWNAWIERSDDKKARGPNRVAARFQRAEYPSMLETCRRIRSQLLIRLMTLLAIVAIIRSYRQS